MQLQRKEADGAGKSVPQNRKSFWWSITDSFENKNWKSLSAKHNMSFFHPV